MPQGLLSHYCTGYSTVQSQAVQFSVDCVVQVPQRRLHVIDAGHFNVLVHLALLQKWVGQLAIQHQKLTCQLERQDPTSY